MKKAFRNFFVCFSTTVLSLSSRAQSIDSVLATYAARYQPEKAYLHYDKSSYAPGETIWFKAYFMEGLFSEIKSKTVYIDWIGDNGDVLTHTVSPIVDASTNGQFEIPTTYTGNFIHVRAYTKWMLNFDTAFLYNKRIHILNKNSGTVKPAIIASIQFFPEGGDAVTGVLNKIAFKATDQWGKPVKVKGSIQDNNGSAITSFYSVHDGMGYFYLLPKQGLSYTAKWKDDKGLEHSTALPFVKNTGISMQVTMAGTKRMVDFFSANPVPDNLKQLHLIGTLNSTLAFKTTIATTQGSSTRRIIPTENLPSGILTITLFDADWNAIAERITFINNHDYSFQPKLEIQHWGLSKRAKNEIKFTVPDSLQSTNLSISITDAAIEKDTAHTIISDLLLTSDLKGYVHNPAFYFSDDSASTAQYLDLVMLTNGWRRFKWEVVAKAKFPLITYPKDTSYLSLSGKVYGVTKSQLSGNDNIVLFVKEKDSGSKIIIIPIQTDGSFNDPGIVFFDTLRVYYHLKSKFLGNAEAQFMTNRLPAPNYKAFSKRFSGGVFENDTTGSFRHFTLAAETLRLQELQKGKLLQNITVTARIKPPVEAMDKKYSSGLFSGGNSLLFDIVNDPFALGRPDVFSYLQGKVAGLQINAISNPPSLSWRDGTPQLFLDEIPVDASMIQAMPMSNIALVKVFRPPFMGAVGGGSGGAIAIYTRKGDDLRNMPGTGLSNNTIVGYTPLKEFYSPNYSSFNQHNEQPDIRTTLYWNPMVMTTATRRSIVFSFYNNDVTKAFRIVIEGVSKEGLLTHYEQIME